MKTKAVDRESMTLSAHPEFLDLIARSRAQFAAGQTLSLDEMKRAVLSRSAANKASHPQQGPQTAATLTSNKRYAFAARRRRPLIR